MLYILFQPVFHSNTSWTFSRARKYSSTAWFAIAAVSCHSDVHRCLTNPPCLRVFVIINRSVVVWVTKGRVISCPPPIFPRFWSPLLHQNSVPVILWVSSQDPGHTHGTMANPQEHLSCSSPPHLPLSESRTFNGLQDELTSGGGHPSPKLFKDQQEKGVVQTELTESMNSPITTTVLTSVSEDSRDQFENSVLQLREQDESEMAVSQGNSNTVDGESTSGTEDIKIQFSRSGSGSGGFLEGLFGCLRPVWNIIGKAYSTDYKLQQQGKLECGRGK